VQAQANSKIAVQFNDSEMPQALDQGLRQSGKTRPNLNHGLAWERLNGINDGVNDPAI
jgi:hypothetical protein